MSKTSLNRQIIWYLSRIEISIVFVANIFENERNFSQKILTVRRKKHMINDRSEKWKNDIFLMKKKWGLKKDSFFTKRTIFSFEKKWRRMKMNKNLRTKKIFWKKTKWVVYKRWTNLYQKVCKLHIRNYLFSLKIETWKIK